MRVGWGWILATSIAAGAVVLADARSPVTSSIRLEDGYIRLSAPGLQIAAGYLTIRNASSQPDELLGAISSRAQGIQIHSSSMQGGVMRMREVKGVTIPAGGSMVLSPGGLHLMVMGLDPGLKPGESVPLELRFRSGTLRVDLPLRAP